MSSLILLAIFAFFSAPFAISGFHRAWRGASCLLVLVALYTGYEWLRPLPPDMHETDMIGATSWNVILLSLFVAAVASFIVGWALSFLRNRWLG